MKNRYSYFNRLSLLFLLLMGLSMEVFGHFGPRSPLAGNVTCSISYNGLVYFGTETGGVFEATSPQLTTWRPRPVGMLTGRVTALAHSGSYLFAGTADGGVYVFDGFVGADRYWNHVSSGLGNINIKSLVAVDSITVLAGTNGGGLYKTINKGATWTAVNDANLNNAIVSGLTQGGGRYFATTVNGGVFASDTEGDTWFSFNDANTLQISGTAALDYNDTTDALLVLNANGLYLAGNAASTLSPTFTGAHTGLPLGADVRALSNNGTTWFSATSMGVYSTPSSTISWVASNSGLTSMDVTAVVALPTTVVTAARKLGIYKSPTASIVWALTNTGFNNPVTHSMITGGDSLVVAVTSEGVFVSRKLGSPATTFVRANHGLTDSTNVVDIILAKSQLWAATPSGVFMTLDSGANWTAVNTGLSNLNIEKLFYGNNRVYAFDDLGGIYVQEMGSSTWTSAPNGLPNGVAPTSMAFYGNRIIVGTMGDGVYMKDQHGLAWSAFHAGLTNMDVTSVTAASGRFYAGTDGNGVFTTLVDSAAWTATGQTSIPFTTLMGLDGDHIQAMNQYAGYVYASYKGGVLTTADEGQLWEEGGTQFNLPSFTNVHKMSFVTTRIFALTDNNGPYANSLAELAILPNFLTLSDDQVMAPIPGRSDFISLNSNVPWTLVSSQPWITVHPASGFRDRTLEIITAPNSGPIRTGQITISSDSLLQTFVIDVMQDGVVSVGPPTASSRFDLFPNPNNGRFTLDFTGLSSEVSKVAVLDLNGRLVREWRVDLAAKQMSAEVHVSPGTYIVRLETATGMFYKRMLVH